jgi:hypothetical protein
MQSYPKFPANAIGSIKYACCKHGHEHSVPCGYAHKLNEVGLPISIPWRMWECKSHEPRGHPGIDFFLGQSFTPQQYDRAIQMLHYEGLDRIPLWARMFAYFQGRGLANEYVLDGDFDLYTTLEQSSEKIL